jgi:arylsulfatase A-like enzyme
MDRNQMRLKHHLFISSYFLTVCAVLWGLTEIITIFSSINFENISYFAYLSILFFPILLYGTTGFLTGFLWALFFYLLFARRWEWFSIRTGIKIYSLLYFIPLILSVEYLWNRRYLPGIPLIGPVSLSHSLAVFLIIMIAMYFSRGLIVLILQGFLTARRLFITGLLIGFAALFYLFINSFDPDASIRDGVPPTPDKPNILLITIDTLRADHLGCYGGSDDGTPMIDALSSGGATFLRATSQVPLTLPSHTSILTSTYPPIHGVRDNAKYRFGGSLPTLAGILKETGYQTAAFVSAFVLDSRFGLDRGFQTYNDKIQNQAYFYFSTASPPFALAALFKLVGFAPPYKPERKADKTTEAVIEWMEENSGNRFFLWIHFFDPHGPLNPPPPYDTLYISPDTDPLEFRKKMATYSSLLGKADANALTEEEIEGIRALYMGEVTYTDHYIGQLTEKLKELGIADRTLTILTADHGQSISEHGYIGHDRELYRDIMQIPLIFHFPGRIPGGMKIDNQVQSIDIMPTTLDLLGIGTHEVCSGRSLMPLILSRSRVSEDPDVYLETLHPRLNKMKLVGLSSGNYKYFRGIEGEREELYRIDTDPQEKENLLIQMPQKAEEMRNKLLELLEGMKDKADTREIPLDPQTMEAMKALGYIQ